MYQAHRECTCPRMERGVPEYPNLGNSGRLSTKNQQKRMNQKSPATCAAHQPSEELTVPIPVFGLLLVLLFGKHIQEAEGSLSGSSQAQLVER